MNYPTHHTAKKAVLVWSAAVEPRPAEWQMAKVRVETATVFFKVSEEAYLAIVHKGELAAADNLVDGIAQIVTVVATFLDGWD